MTPTGLDMLWRHMWQITLLIPVTVWLVRWTCRQRPHLAHAVLLLCLLKCLVPPLWSSPTGIFCWVDRPAREATVSPAQPTNVHGLSDQEVQSALGQTSVPPEPVATTEASSAGFLPSMTTGMLMIWFAGAVGILGYLGGKGLQLLRFHEDTQVEPSDELLEVVEHVGDQLELRRNPRLLVTMHPTIPFASGIFSPRVVLPDHLAINASPSDLKFIVAHELTHLRRGDLFFGAFQLLVQAVLWFHPLVWWLNREIRRVREDCCDEEVLARLQCSPKDYARCLINVLDLQQRLRSMPELAGLKPIEVTEQRLTNIIRKGRSHATGLQLAGYAAVGLLAILLLPGAAIPHQTVVVTQSTNSTVPFPENSAVPIDPEITGPKEPVRVLDVKADPVVNHNPLPNPEPGPVPVAIPEQVATPMPVTVPEPIAVPVPAAVVQGELPAVKLRYGLQNGEWSSYQVSIELDYPERTRRWAGSVQMNVVDSRSESFVFSLNSISLSEMSQSKPGSRSFPYGGPSFDFPRAPSLPGFNRPSGSRFPGMDLPGMPRANQGTWLDRRGEVIRLEETESFPLLIGDLTGLLFPQLPRTTFRQWGEAADVQLPVRTDSPTDHMTPLSMRSPSTRKEAHVEDVWTTLPRIAGTPLQVRRVLTATTAEQVDDGPAIKLQTTSDMTWDEERGNWKEVSISGEAMERSPNVQTRIPLKITISRQ